ncbi:MAG: hypothetical protein AAGG44_00585 [Planctomycetota bacterium]
MMSLSPMAIPIVAIVSVFGWLIIHSLVSGVRAIVKHRNEVELKQSLVDRGMSADEIERVVTATAIPPEEDDS